MNNSVMAASATFLTLLVVFGVVMGFGAAYYWGATLYATAAGIFAAANCGGS